MGLTFRPAVEADKDFARRVYIATTRPYVDHLPDWTDGFLAARFERRFIVAATRMVERAGVTIGWMRLSENEASIVLEQLYIDPSCHRQGIGTELLTQLVGGWRRAGKDVRLRTLRRNPARRLYERFGFHVVDDSDPNSVGMRLYPQA